MADNSVRIGLPAWTDRLAKHGPWVLLCFVLIYALIYQPRPATHDQVQEGFDHVLANQAQIENRLAEAQKVMYSAALQRDRRDEAVVQLLTQLCLQMADGEASKRECRAAMRGQANQGQ